MNNNFIVDIVSEYDSVVICGYGDYGKYVENIIREYFPNKSICICDNSKKKQDESVYSVNMVCKRARGSVFILCTRHSNSMFREQLVAEGIDNKDIIDGITDEAKEKIQSDLYIQKRKPLKKIQFEIDIVSHCNLNCKCCSQFSSISNEEFAEVKKVEQDFQRLGNVFNGECSRIYLIGGEPLLHPDLESFMRIARENFPIGEISVFSNVILLDKQPQSFWKACRDYNISILYTRYPINLDYEHIKKIARINGVEISSFSASEDFKNMKNLGLNPEGTEDIMKSFSLCDESNNCIKLKDGYLYTCTRPATIYRFNRFFNKDLVVRDEDRINIYSTDDPKKILDFLAKPIPFCRYCKMDEKKTMIWGCTEKKIEEWE